MSRGHFIKSIFSLACLFSSLGFASSQPYTFLTHPNRVFVETGSYLGDGIYHARIAGFKEINSIELSPKYFVYCKERFNKDPNIFIHRGDSGKILFKIIKDINEPITFWLDGHYSGEDTACGDKMSPILEELEQIKQHPIKTHTILIDDVRQFGTWHFDGITEEEILEKLYEINPNYTIRYEVGYQPCDILVAEIK